MGIRSAHSDTIRSISMLRLISKVSEDFLAPWLAVWSINLVLCINLFESELGS